VGVDLDQSEGKSEPGIAAQGSEAVIVFVAAIAGMDHVFARRRTSGVWGVPEDIATGAAPAFGPEVVTLENQNLLVTYVQQATNQVMALRWNGSVWQVPSPIAGALTFDRHSLAALPGNEAIVAFRNAGSKLFISRYNGSQWSAPAGIATPDVDIIGGPAVARGIVDAEVELAYVTLQNTAFHTRYIAGGWTPPAMIATNPGLTRIAIASAP
jgi:hypothetical protein